MSLPSNVYWLSSLSWWEVGYETHLDLVYICIWNKQIYVAIFSTEPRGADEFESVLGEYYDSIHGKSKTSRRKTKASQKRLSKNFSLKGSPESSLEGGAALLAVCRGKVGSIFFWN